MFMNISYLVLELHVAETFGQTLVILDQSNLHDLSNLQTVRD